MASSSESERNLKSLGVKKVKFIGNIKFCGSTTHNNDKYELKSIFNNHFIWCAASTHKEEEEIILKTHKLLKSKIGNLLTIIIPRHVTRSKEVYEISNKFNLKSQIVNKFNEIL